MRALRPVLLFLLLFSLPATAAELNGSGIRKRLFFEVYSISLFLPKKTSSAQESVSGPGEKRIEIRMLRDVDAETFTGALVDGIRSNHSEAEAKALEPQVKQLADIMAERKEAKKGMQITLGWNGRETQVVIDGKPAGKPIAGEAFYQALLRIWLGEKPVQEDLKKALLGGA